MGIPGLIPILRKMGIFEGTFIDIPHERADVELSKLAVGKRFQYMCFDLPGLLHKLTAVSFGLGEYSNLNKLVQPGSTLDEATRVVALEVVNAIRHQIYICNPEEVVIAMDGPVPAAKMKQQRERRFKGKSSDSQRDTFDTNQITAGTPYMKLLEKKMIALLKEFAKNNQLPNITFLGQAEYGEGEHKLMKFLREKANPKRSQLIYGADTDLIILASLLDTHVILKQEDRTVHVIIDKFKAALEKAKIRLLDWCAVISLIGNDFLPHHDVTTDRDLMSEIVHHLFNLLIQAEEDIVLEDQYGYYIRWSQMNIIISGLAAKESEWLRNFGTKLVSQKNNSFVYPANFSGAIDPKFINNWYRREIFHGRKTIPGIDIKGNVLSREIQEMIIKTKNDMCKHVAIGLQWILSYYTGKNVDPTWQYPYTYFPIFTSLDDYLSSENSRGTYYIRESFRELDRQIVVERPANIHTLIHRICVLPPASWEVCFTEKEMERISKRLTTRDYVFFPTKVEVSTKDLTRRRTYTRSYKDINTYIEDTSMNVPEMYYHVYTPYVDPHDIAKIFKVTNPKYSTSIISIANTSSKAYDTYQSREQKSLINSYRRAAELKEKSQRAESSDKNYREKGQGSRRTSRETGGETRRETRGETRREESRSNRPSSNQRPSGNRPSSSPRPSSNLRPTRKKTIEEINAEIPLYDRNIILEIPQE